MENISYFIPVALFIMYALFDIGRIKSNTRQRNEESNYIRNLLSNQEAYEELYGDDTSIIEKEDGTYYKSTRSGKEFKVRDK